MSNKYHNFVTPRMTAKYPKLDQPYSFNMKLNKSVPDEEGQFEVVGVMADKDAAPFVKLIQDAIKDSGTEPANLPFKKVKDKDTGKPTGEVEFKFKAYGKTKEGKPAKIRFFDSKAKPIPSTIELTSGSVIKIDGYITVAKLGARLNIRGVQVISLAEAQSSFTAEEDGYEYVAGENSFAEDNSEAGSDDSFDF